MRIKDDVNLRELEKYGYEVTENCWEELGEDCFEAIKQTNNGEIVIHERNINGYYVETDSTYDYFPIKVEDIQDLIDDGLVEVIEWN